VNTNYEASHYVISSICYFITVTTNWVVGGKK